MEHGMANICQTIRPYHIIIGNGTIDEGFLFFSLRSFEKTNVWFEKTHMGTAFSTLFTPIFFNSWPFQCSHMVCIFLFVHRDYRINLLYNALLCMCLCACVVYRVFPLYTIWVVGGTIGRVFGNYLKTDNQSC